MPDSRVSPEEIARLREIASRVDSLEWSENRADPELSRLFNALPSLLDEIERLREENAIQREAGAEMDRALRESHDIGLRRGLREKGQDA